MSYNKIDSSHEFTYPTSPDARGSTRVNHRRRPYYLGPHDSPLSYVMFGLWKHRLQETGEPPSTKEIRALAEELLSRGTIASTQSPHFWTKPSTILSAIGGVVLCALLVFMIPSSSNPPQVDEFVLSESEADVIRTLRTRSSLDARLESERPDPVAAKLRHLLAEGSESGAKHIASSSF